MATKIIGLAGPMASGKNAAANFLEEEGFIVIDVDKLGHKALELLKERIIEVFTEQAKEKNLELLNEDESLNRRSLGQIVFASKRNLRLHESIMHPKMNELIVEEMLQNEGKNFVINAAILHKFDVIKQCDYIIFVTANPFLRYKRAKERSKVTKKQFFKTFLSQIEIYSKCKKLNADIYKVDNSDTQENLKTKIKSFLA